MTPSFVAVVAATDYRRERSSVPPTTCAELGARAIGSVLEAHGAVVHKILDRESPLTRETLLAKLDELSKLSPSPIQVLLYLAAWGITSREYGAGQLRTDFLMGDSDLGGRFPTPYDPVAATPIRALQDKELYQHLFSIRAERFLILVDGPYKLEDPQASYKDWADGREISVDMLTLGSAGSRRPDFEEGAGVFGGELLRMLRSKEERFTARTLITTVELKLASQGMRPVTYSFGRDGFQFHYDWYDVNYPAPGPQVLTEKPMEFHEPASSMDSPPPPPGDAPIPESKPEPEAPFPPADFVFPPDLDPKGPPAAAGLPLKPGALDGAGKGPEPGEAEPVPRPSFVIESLCCAGVEHLATAGETIVAKRKVDMLTIVPGEGTAVRACNMTARSLVVSPLGNYAAVVGRDPAGLGAAVHLLASGERYRLPGSTTAVAFGKGPLVWLGSQDGEIALMNIENRETMQRIRVADQPVTALCTFRDTVLAGLCDGRVMCVNDGAVLEVSAPADGNRNVEAIAATMDGSLIVWCTQDEVAICCRGEIERLLPIQSGAARSVKLSYDGGMALFETRNGLLLLLDLTCGRHASPAPVAGVQTRVAAAAFGGPGMLWVAAGDRVERWDLSRVDQGWWG